MSAVDTVNKAAFSVVTPRPCKEYRSISDRIVAGEAAVCKDKADLLPDCMCGCRGISAAAHIGNRTDLASGKERIAAAENEIDISGDQTLPEYLTHAAASAERGLQKAVIPPDQILRKRSAEYGILRGPEHTVSGSKVIRDNRQRNLLSFSFRLQRVIFDRQVPECDMRCKHGCCVGAEGVICSAGFVGLFRIIAEHDFRVLRQMSDELNARNRDLDLFPVYPRLKQNSCAGRYSLQHLRKTVLRRDLHSV